MVNSRTVFRFAAQIIYFEQTRFSHDLLQLFQWNKRDIHVYCSIEAALSVFSQMRPPGIYKQDYLSELFARYGEREDTPLAPPLPAWYLGQYLLCVSIKR